MPPGARSRHPSIALVLSGGNALGAYAAGAYETMHAAGFEPDLISGASIGAVNGAIIAGNSPDRRIAMLREFWGQAATGTPALMVPAAGKPREAYNLASTMQTLLLGRPGLFAPRFPGLLSTLPGMPADVAIFDHRLGVATLRRVIDFDVLNGASPPLIVTATDAQTGDLVRFDTRADALSPAHFLASTAMPPFFPPVAIDDRLLIDPGLVENLPLDPALDSPPEQGLLCIALDAFAPNGEPIRDLDSVAERAQDILFAGQSRRSLEHHAARYGVHRERSKAARASTLARERVTVVYLAYRAPSYERAGKSLDFSRASLEERWSTGRRDMERALENLAAGRSANGNEMFRVVDAR